MLTRVENRLRIVLKRITFKRRLPAHLGGATIHVSPGSDLRFIGKAWLVAYEELFSVARDFLRRGDHVWDVGANVGVFTFAALDRIGDAGSVTSIEPDPELSALMSRTRLSLPQTKALMNKVITVAIAERPSILDLVIPINGSARNHLADVDGNQAKSVYDRRACVALSADWLLDHSPAPDFVKIDVEGAEVSVLNGGVRLLRDVRPGIYIEVNAENTQAVTSILRNYAYELFYCAHHKWVRVEDCRFNTLAVPEERVAEYFRGNLALRGGNA